MRRRLIRGFYPALVGVMLGLLQTGLFFQLSFTLSSSFRTYLLITICWLAGSAMGVALARRTPMSRRRANFVLMAAMASYFACAVLLAALPFNSALSPVYAALVAVTGLYPGIFFVRMGQVYTARALFFRENNGFIAGIVAGTLAFMVLGRSVLWAAPLSVALLVWMLPEPAPAAPRAPDPFGHASGGISG
jgi:hypothetical protein